jgi:hypothetical protein
MRRALGGALIFSASGWLIFPLWLGGYKTFSNKNSNAD